MAATGRRGALILVLSLILLIAFADLAEGYKKIRPSQCKGKCKIRCSATSHKKPCMFFCQKCCAKCLCVPPGVYGNKQKCGTCYNNWKTKEGRPKCP